MKGLEVEGGRWKKERKSKRWNAEEKGKKAKGEMFRSEVNVEAKQEKAKVKW